ncbi:Rha family transcriptional regulator [Desulfosporosinus fructosivorans]
MLPEMNLPEFNIEGVYTDSRIVAKMIGRPHYEVMAMIEGQKHKSGRTKHAGFLSAISENGLLDVNEWFVKSTYKVPGNNKTYPCYLISKKGCDMIGLSMSGEKGTLFAIAYINKFNEMKEELERRRTLAPRTYKEELQDAIAYFESHKSRALSENGLIPGE